MSSPGLLHEIKTRPLVLLAVIAGHFALMVMLGLNLSNTMVHKPAGAEKKIVQAVAVDATQIEAEARKLKQVEEKKRQQALAQERKIKQQQEKAKQQLADEQRRLAELKKKKADEQKNLDALKQKNLAEKKRLEAEKKKMAAEKKEQERKQAEAEKKKQQELLAQREAEAEKKRQQELEEQRQAEAEKKKQQELAAQRKAEEESRRKEEAAELQRKLAEEERMEEAARQAAEKAARLQTLRSQYVRLIEQKVERNWLRPVTATSDMFCEIIVTQTSLGDVIDVILKKCVNDLAFQRSIERAVRKASPLPPPPSPEVFDREIHFTFRPNI